MVLQAYTHYERDIPKQAADPIRRLAQAVTLQAMSEAADGNAGALDFLKDSAASDTWLDVAQISREDVVKWILAGCKRVPGWPRRIKA